MEASKDADDLDSNTFYQALQGGFQSVFNTAQNRCCLICCPCNASLQGLKLDQNFIEMHILNPSPYFKGQFVTSNKKNRGTIQLENNVIHTLEGFSEDITVHVLSEETAYNKAFKPFTILILDRPLFGGHSKKAAVSCEKGIFSTSKRLEVLNSYEDCKMFLDSIPECKKAMDRVTETIKRFCTNYMILREFLSDAACRLAKITDDASRDFTGLLRDAAPLDHRLKENIDKAMESHVLYSISDKLYPVIQQHCSTADHRLESKLRELRQVSASQLGVSAQFCCPLPSVIAHLNKIDDLKTPLEKLRCLKSTLDSITSDVNDYVQSTEGTLFTDPQHLTSDDLIPIVVYAMCQSDDLKLNADIYYIEHFHSSLSTTNQFSFTLVTFKAAIQHVLTLVPQSSKTRITKTPIVKKCENIEPPSAGVSHEAPPAGNVDKQLDRVLRQFHNSMRQLQQVDQHSALRHGQIRKQNRGNSEEQSQLGDFLSSLQDDVGSSYGRQT